MQSKKLYTGSLPKYARQKIPKGAQNNIQKTTWHRAIETYSPRLFNLLVRYASG